MTSYPLILNHNKLLNITPGNRHTNVDVTKHPTIETCTFSNECVYIGLTHTHMHVRMRETLQIPSHVVPCGGEATFQRNFPK